MSKHYCIFSAQYYPHVGGVERYTLYLSRKLIFAGNEVTIVTSNTGDLSGDEIQKESDLSSAMLRFIRRKISGVQKKQRI